MASQLARTKLARAACGLNARHGFGLPPIFFMTDDVRVSDPITAAHFLPKGSAVILRHRDSKKRADLAATLLVIARRNGLALMIADDVRLARALGADGVHFPERETAHAAHCRALCPGWLITVAAHSERALLGAARAGADAALLAPVFPTKSHPDKKALGPLRLRLMASRAPLPVYALGGISAANIGALASAKLAGIAAIEGLLAR